LDAKLRREVRRTEARAKRELAARLEQVSGQEYNVEVSIRVTVRDRPARDSQSSVTDQTRYDWPPEKFLIVLEKPTPLSVIFEALKRMDMPRNVRNVIMVLYATENEPLTPDEVSELGGPTALDEVRQFLRYARMPFTLATGRKSRSYRLLLLKPPEPS
jgi:hypothetical protein